MSIAKGATFPLEFVSTTTSGAANTSTTPTIYISKDTGAITATTNAATSLGMGLWLISLTATEMNADTVGWIAVGSGLSPCGGTIVTEGNYTAALAANLAALSGGASGMLYDPKPTPLSDTIDLPNGPCDAIISTNDGTVMIVAAGDATNTPVAIPVQAGVIMPVRAKRLLKTNSNQTGNIHPLYKAVG